MHALTEDKDDEIKNEFYDKCKHLVDQLLNDYMKIKLGIFNAKIDKKDIFKSTIGFKSVHEESN